MKNEQNRREFLKNISGGTLSLAAVSVAAPVSKAGVVTKDAGKLAILGGQSINAKKAIGKSWPHIDEALIESVMKTTKSGIWSRIQSANGTVATFEKEFAKQIGAGYAVGTGSGTQALSTAVLALGIGPGDEVITSPYTDFGTISAILTSRALPVLVDLDLESFQLDPELVEKAITKNTKAIMPVHIMGVPANMERIMAIAAKHKLKVIEDSCQAPFSRYQGKAIGMIGDLGCFSFQASKAIACGEGGAVVGNDQALMDECFTIQNRGAARSGKNVTIGPKYRMNEFEGAVLMGQIAGAKERFEIRNANAAYLNSKLKEIPGITPQKHYPGTESGSYYHYGVSYNKSQFNNTDRAVFLKAMNAEGIPVGSYIKSGLHREPWVDHIIGLNDYKTMYSAQRLKDYKASMVLPNCDRICNETLVSFWGSGILLGTREEMDMIVNAFTKVYENREKLASVK
jgi:perosamine synthetase